MGRWSPYRARNTCVIIWIENKVAEEGESSEPAYVAATIKYVDGRSNVAGHNRAKLGVGVGDRA
jgi:hypothetical protein